MSLTEYLILKPNKMIRLCKSIFYIEPKDLWWAIVGSFIVSVTLLICVHLPELFSIFKY